MCVVVVTGEWKCERKGHARVKKEWKITLSFKNEWKINGSRVLVSTQIPKFWDAAHGLNSIRIAVTSNRLNYSVRNKS